MKSCLVLTLRAAAVIAAVSCIAGCAVKRARIPPPVQVTTEKKDGLTELLGGGNKIFARYITHKRAYGADDIIPSPDYLQGKIIGREIEICFENPLGEVRVIKRLKDDKELKHVHLISRFRYNPRKDLLAFTPERRGTIFVISVKSGRFIQKIESAAEPHWSVDGTKLLYIDTKDEQDKEMLLSP